MPAWEPSVPDEFTIGEKFKFLSDWYKDEKAPQLKSEHSLAQFTSQFKFSDPDIFNCSDQSATTCSVPSPGPAEETKGSQLVIIGRKN